MQEIPAVQINQLRFGFPKQPDLFDHLELTIPQGTTFGILGPNGTGKSTLIKMVLGLIPFRLGSIDIFGKKILHHRREILRKVGFLIEAPRLYHHLSGMDNLKVFATYRQVDFRILEGILDEVGLTPHAGKLVRHYSSGMKQRLAIAIALLHDPNLLILDEPTNALDPEGIVEIRQLITKIRKQPNRTILFCSHILSEVQRICDHVGVLHQGKFVFQGRFTAFHSPSANYLIETDNPQQTAQMLNDYSNRKISVEGTAVSVLLPKPGDVNEVIDLLRAANISIFQVRKLEENLESVYLRLTK